MQKKLVETTSESLNFSSSKADTPVPIVHRIGDVTLTCSQEWHSTKKYDRELRDTGLYLQMKTEFGWPHRILFSASAKDVVKVERNQYLVVEDDRSMKKYYKLEELHILFNGVPIEQSAENDSIGFERHCTRDGFFDLFNHMSCGGLETPVMKFCDYLMKHSSHKVEITDPQQIRTMQGKAVELSQKNGLFASKSAADLSVQKPVADPKLSGTTYSCHL